VLSFQYNHTPGEPSTATRAFIIGTGGHELETGAESDIATIYASRVRVGDTRWTVEQAPVGWSLFHDSGQLTVAELDDNSATIVLTGYSAICRELAEVNAGYFDGMLKASGARSTRVEVVEVSADGAQWSLSWE
jgi:uncharacterized protein (TIGR02265 family)